MHDCYCGRSAFVCNALGLFGHFLYHKNPLFPLCVCTQPRQRLEAFSINHCRHWLGGPGQRHSLDLNRVQDAHTGTDKNSYSDWSNRTHCYELTHAHIQYAHVNINQASVDTLKGDSGSRGISRRNVANVRWQDWAPSITSHHSCPLSENWAVGASFSVWIDYVNCKLKLFCIL